MRIDEDERRKLVKKFGEKSVEEVEKDISLMSPDARALRVMDLNVRMRTDDDGLHVYSEKLDETFTFEPENEIDRKAIQWFTHPRAIGDGISEYDWEEIREVVFKTISRMIDTHVMSVDRPDLYKSLMSQYLRVMFRRLPKN